MGMYLSIKLNEFSYVHGRNAEKITKNGDILVKNGRRKIPILGSCRHFVYYELPLSFLNSSKVLNQLRMLVLRVHVNVFNNIKSFHYLITPSKNAFKRIVSCPDNNIT